jgi:endonuclease YncB( thermonuclease family)
MKARFGMITALALSISGLVQGEAAPVQEQTFRDCAVLNVHDGDTLNALCGKHSDRPVKLKVRLHCIDAPELGQAPWGRESREHLRGLIGEGPVDLQVVDQDKYGRSVAEVWKGGININLKLAEAGQAAVYWQHCESLSYGVAEVKARLADAGIWRQLGLHQRPWAYRHGSTSWKY